MNDLTKNLLIWAFIALVLVAVFSKFSASSPNSAAMPYSDFLNRVHSSSIKDVEIRGQKISGTTTTGEKFVTYSPPNDPKLVDDLNKYNVKFQAAPPEERSLLLDLVINWCCSSLLLVYGFISCAKCKAAAVDVGRCRLAKVAPV